MTAVGRVRFSSGNHLYAAWIPTEKAGPSPAPRRIRQTTSVASPTGKSIGNCTSDQERASPRISQRADTRFARNPTTTAEIENRKKKLDPSKPNSLGVRLRSLMIGAAASPTTVLSAKLMSMKKNKAVVMVHAPGGV